MVSTRTALMLAASLLILSGCNMPLPGRTEEPVTGRVDVATEYRSGPGDAYDLLGTMHPDQEFEIVGLSQDGGYLLVRDPADPVVVGWMKSKGATLSGSSTGLPIFDAPAIPTPIDLPPETGGCPTPVGGGPTPVSCPTPMDDVPPSSGCPTPVGGGPTPVSCPTLPAGGPRPSSGCPTPIGGGPTPVSCPTPVVGPTPVGPTPVDQPTPVDRPTPVDQPPPPSGCPTPVGGGPTPVSCPTPVS